MESRPKHRRFLVEIEEVHATSRLWVVATSRAEAVDRARKAFKDKRDWHQWYPGNGVIEAGFRLTHQPNLGEENIRAEEPLDEIPEDALLHLLNQGYKYFGNEVEEWKQLLLWDGEAQFEKYLRAGEEFADVIYVRLDVMVTCRHTGKWRFYFGAYLYFGLPLGGPEKPKVPHRVKFESDHPAVSAADLPTVLQEYEAKYTNLIFALRKSDPVDGLPLTPQESVRGAIQGFSKTEKSKTSQGHFKPRLV